MVALSDVTSQKLTGIQKLQLKRILLKVVWSSLGSFWILNSEHICWKSSFYRKTIVWMHNLWYAQLPCLCVLLKENNGSRSWLAPRSFMDVFTLDLLAIICTKYWIKSSTGKETQKRLPRRYILSSSIYSSFWFSELR